MVTCLLLAGWRCSRSEFALVRRILMTGLHRRIRYLGVEWHHNNYWVLGDSELTERYTFEHNCLQYVWEKESSMSKVEWAR